MIYKHIDWCDFHRLFYSGKKINLLFMSDIGDVPNEVVIVK